MPYKAKGGWRFLNNEEIEQDRLRQVTHSWCEEMEKFVGMTAFDILEKYDKILHNPVHFSEKLDSFRQKKITAWKWLFYRGENRTDAWEVASSYLTWDDEIELMYPDIEFTCICESLEVPNNPDIILKTFDSVVCLETTEGMKYREARMIRHNKDMSTISVETVGGFTRWNEDIQFITKEMYNELL